MSTTFSTADVKKIAAMANIPLKDEELEPLAQGFKKTLEVVDVLQSVDVSHIQAAHQVTNLENVMREDIVDDARMFTQEQALLNAKRTYNGYFVVDQVIDQE